MAHDENYSIPTSTYNTKSSIIGGPCYYDRRDTMPREIDLECLDCHAQTMILPLDLVLAGRFLECDACGGIMLPVARLAILDLGHILTASWLCRTLIAKSDSYTL